MKFHKNHSLRYYLLFTITALLFLVYGCTKLDVERSREITSLSGDKFFSKSSNKSPQVQRVIEEFKNRNVETNLIIPFLKKYGEPLWDKAFVVKSKRKTNARSTEGLTDTVIIIPVIQPDIQEVQSYIKARLSDSVQLEIHTESEYRNLRFSNAETLTNEAEKLAIRFMLLNKDVFSHESFIINDKRLFHHSSNYSDTANTVRMLSLQTTQSNSRLITVCVDIITTTTNYHCTNTGTCTSGICDNCYLCVTSSTSISTACESWWDDDGEGGGDTGGGGGGTGGDPCSGRGSITGALPCGDPGGGGWDPIPIDDEPQQNPCDQVKAVANNVVNATYMQKVKDLGTSLNLNLNYEKTVSLIEGTPPIITEGSGTSNNASAQLPDITGQKYLSFSHTHPNIPPGTYSVFSFGDLRRMSMLLHSGQLESDKFVAYLSTYKGTYYALTISDMNKFSDFFYYYNNSGSSAQGNIIKWLESQNKANRVEQKYFQDKVNPLIKETDIDNNNVLSMFLDFMKEANLGVTLFESNANFDTFTKVEKQSNGIINRTPCN